MIIFSTGGIPLHQKPNFIISEWQIMQCRIITSKDNTEVSIKERVPQETTVKRYKFLPPIWKKTNKPPLKQIPRRCLSSLESHLFLLWQWPVLSAPKTFVLSDKYGVCKEWPGETNRRKKTAGQSTYCMLYCHAHHGRSEVALLNIHFSRCFPRSNHRRYWSTASQFL